MYGAEASDAEDPVMAAYDVDVDFHFDYKAMEQVMNEAGIKPLLLAGADVERFAKEGMKKGGGKDKIPSEPGEPPHRQSGELASSVTHAATTGLEVVVGPTKIYGKRHELGEGTPKRPFMLPALNRMLPNFAKYFQNLPLGRTPTGARLNTRYNKR